MRLSDERIRTSDDLTSPGPREEVPTPEREADGFQWDWVTFVAGLVAAGILAMLTFELWASHGPPHR